MLTYAESSAVATWLLGQEGCREVADALGRSEGVSCSALTILECDRAVTRRVLDGSLSREEAARARGALEKAALRWSVVPVTAEILAGARRVFPREPVRALDAIHLVTVLVLRASVPGLVVLALDRRVAENASLLGFEVLPRDPGVR